MGRNNTVSGVKRKHENEVFKSALIRLEDYLDQIYIYLKPKIFISNSVCNDHEFNRFKTAIKNDIHHAKYDRLRLNNMYPISIAIL